MSNITRCLFLFILFVAVSRPKIIDYELPEFETSTIRVEIKGEVGEPGVYEVPAYSTLEQLLESVELTDEADLSNLNETAVLKDQDVIVIPSENRSVLQVSINTADLEDLVLIPGIGNTTAQNIIDYRNEHGLFQSLEDLVRVKGIGIKTLERMMPYISL